MFLFKDYSREWALKGLCVICGNVVKPGPRGGKKKCENCRFRHEEERKRRILDNRTPKETRLKQRERAKALSKKGISARIDWCLGKALDENVPYKDRNTIANLKMVLRVYDHNPAGFREWLVAKLKASGVDIESKAED